MTTGLTDLRALLRTMQPTLNDGVYVYAMVPPDRDLGPLAPLGTFREAEGVTVIVTEDAAHAAGIAVLFRAAWITLKVHSGLHAVGLTAAFAGALGEAGLSCNVIAGACHDHLFVPVEDGPRALGVLQALQRRAMGD